MNGQMRKRRPFFFYATLLSTQFADPLVPTSSSPAFTPTLLRGLGEGGGSHQWFRQLHSRAPCTHVEKRVTIAPFEFAIVFRHSACHVENSLRRFATVGQTRDSLTRVAKHTCASLQERITRDNLF